MKSELLNLEKMALKAMMNPDFVFNVLNSIQYHINAGFKEIANQYLTDFASFIRICTRFSEREAVSFAEELEYLNLYLKLENLRFEEKFSYSIEYLPEIDLEKVFIPVMMIQPFLENAIWHGILPTQSKGQLNVKILKVSPDILRIEVEDNGVGIGNDYIGRNLLIDNPIKIEPCIAIKRLKILKETTFKGLYMQYRHLSPEAINKGTLAEFQMPYWM